MSYLTGGIITILYSTQTPNQPNKEKKKLNKEKKTLSSVFIQQIIAVFYQGITFLDVHFTLRIEQNTLSLWSKSSTFKKVDRV